MKKTISSIEIAGKEEELKMGSWKFYEDVVPFTAMVAAQTAGVALNTSFKAASMEGLNFFVFTVYMSAITTLLLLPVSVIFLRKTELPSSLFPLFWRICVLGCLCFSANVFGFKGIEYSSPTLASAMANLTPAFTFTLAIIFRMEKVAVRSSSFKAKLIGTVVSISGALVVVLYKGPIILQTPSSLLNRFLESSQSNWVIGGLLLFAQCLVLSLWYIILTDIMKIYRAEVVVSFFQSLCVTILSIPVGLIAEPELSAWKPASSTAWVTFILSGFVPAFSTVIVTWSLHMKGPVYVAAFPPLAIAIAVAAGVLFLGDALHLGSVIGAFILSAGVYAVIWGNSPEEKMTKKCFGTSSNGRTTPLLQSEDLVNHA